MKNKKKTIVIVALIVLVALILSFLARFAYAVVAVKSSDSYQYLCSKASLYDEFGYLKGFDPSTVDMSWYEDTRVMSDEEFFNWAYENMASDSTELTLEQYVLTCFHSPLRTAEEYRACETDWDRYELSLKYSTEADLKAYNEKHSTNFNSIEEAVYAYYSESRSVRIVGKIMFDSAVVSFVEEHHTPYGVDIWNCADDVLAAYYGHEVTDEEINIMIEDRIGHLDFYSKLIFRYFYNHEWRNLAVRDALMNKKQERLYNDFH
jgi:hypothetical protein